MISPRYDQSLEFLTKWSSQGPWVLTAIDPDKKGIETRTFRPSTTADLMKWLAVQGESRNIYFSVNPPISDMSKKADRSEIKSLNWLHVDIDPRAGEDMASEQTRALGLLREPPNGIKKPTVIVFSGGGYQGFWKLKEPIEVNGDLAIAEEVKRYNLYIEMQYAADNVHNIDRIMRLPGTINRPDKKKRAKGRVDALAELIEWHEDRIYGIDEFMKAAQVQTGMSSGFAANTVKVSGNIKRLATVDELPDKMSNRSKVVIVQGHDPDEPNKFSSRSEWLFYACCEMVRASCDDDTIFSVITDPSFGISSSVLDKGSNFEKYALRQIERAKEDAIDPDLRKMNEVHAVIGNWNGKCRVIEEVYDHTMKRYRVTKQSFEDFRNRYMSQIKAMGMSATNQPITKPLGHWWLSHPNRRQFENLVFAPGREVPGAYNLWRGFACEPKFGDCSLFLDHLKMNVCNNDPLLYDYLIGWMACSVQKPDSPGYSAIVMRGGQGTGKSFVAKIIGSLFGRHYMQVTDPKHLVGSFNAHLRDCVMLFGDEAFYAGDKKHESVLKMLVTEELITIEAKGVDAEASPNCVHLMMASNEQWVVPAGLDDRRFFVLDVNNNHKGDHAYFAKIVKQIDNGGREALLYFLLNHDISNFNVRNVPRTMALQEQKILSLGYESEWWYSRLCEGRICDDHPGWKTEICTFELTNSFLSYCRNFQTKRGNQTRLTFAMKKFIPNLPKPEQRRQTVTIKNMDGKEQQIERPYWLKIPSLKECRDLWDLNFGGPYQWSIEDSSPANETKEIPF